MSDNTAEAVGFEKGELLRRKSGGLYTFLRPGRPGFVYAFCHEHQCEEAWPADHFTPKQGETE